MLGYIPFVAFALFIPGIALSVRRLHDSGKSGWLIFLILVPIFGWVALIVWYAQRGDAFSNKWGESPTNSTENDLPSS